MDSLHAKLSNADKIQTRIVQVEKPHRRALTTLHIFGACLLSESVLLPLLLLSKVISFERALDTSGLRIVVKSCETKG